MSNINKFQPNLNYCPIPYITLKHCMYEKLITFNTLLPRNKISSMPLSFPGTPRLLMLTHYP